MLAGILSGFGLGGGIVLVPMLRSLKVDSLEATASCSFIIFITSFVNCTQGIFIGVIRPSEFFFYLIVLSVCGYFMSKLIATTLRRNNRLSLAQGTFFVISLIAMVNIPISLYQQYAGSDYDSEVVLGFGSIC